MFKVRMQGQYGATTDKRLRDVAKEMWRNWGFRKGVMRGYWVATYIVVLMNLADQRLGHCG
jgi:solute carrier family 25 carnitine/acylcarnitine transporter 20/29